MSLKFLVPVVVLCLVNYSHGKPSTDYLTEGRGVGSTLWGWITYPFSWWSSNDAELPPAPAHDQLIGSPYTPYDNVMIAKRNVTVWCNDQTCTTMKCDKFGCKNITCNIYDTDLRGECREYNTELKPEEPIPVTPAGIAANPTLQDKVTEPMNTPQSSSVTVSTTQASPQVDEHPLELEAVLSSTVTEGNEKDSPGMKHKSSSPINKVCPYDLITNADQRSFYSYLNEADKMLSQHILTMLKNYVTELTNKLITNLDMDSFCADGVCYYTTCEGHNCETRYCKYNLVTGESKCSTNKSMKMYKLDLQSNKIMPLSNEGKKILNTNAANSEPNDLKLINKILNK